MTELEPGRFQITEVRVFGDPTEGESQQVFVGHICPITEDVNSIETGFGKYLSGERSVTCPDCSVSVTIIKEGGVIFINQ